MKKNINWWWNLKSQYKYPIIGLLVGFFILILNVLLQDFQFYEVELYLLIWPIIGVLIGVILGIKKFKNRILIKSGLIGLIIGIFYVLMLFGFVDRICIFSMDSIIEKICNSILFLPINLVPNFLLPNVTGESMGWVIWAWGIYISPILGIIVGLIIGFIIKILKKSKE